MTLPQIHALIPAAGKGQRFTGRIPKQYVELLGRPLIAHSIDAVKGHSAVNAVTVALAPDDTWFAQLLQEEYPDVHLVVGGTSRAESVLNGLNDIESKNPECQWVLVHDAARPCLAARHLARLIERATASSHGGILAVPVSDTLKRADGDRIENTVDRSKFWAAQTPQLFPVTELRTALQMALSMKHEPTDEAAAMEQAGFHPLLVEGDSSNLKVTRSSDLSLAEHILRLRSQEDG